MSKSADASGGLGGQLPQPRKRGKRPEAFMFIDASNGGVNAKPDKVVRSFVMKSARNKKTWSTKPKFSKAETSTSEELRRSSCQTHSSHEEGNATAYVAPLERGAYAVPTARRVVTSPGSTSSNSVYSCQSSSRTCESPVSSHASPCVDHEYAEDASNLANPRQIALTHHSSFNLDHIRPPCCLAVQLNAREASLLHQFVAAYTPYLLPIDPYKSSEAAAIDWVASCVQSPVCAPFIFAALTSSSRAARFNSEIYKWRAISEVNKVLADPKKNTDDTIIAAVLMLLALEEADLADPKRIGDARKSSVSANEAHLNGLSTMILQRGGLSALEGNRCLQVFILMHSIAQSITTFKRPYAVITDVNGQVEDYASISFKSPSAFANTLQHFHNLGIDHTLFGIISTIAIFISDLTGWYETSVCPVDSLELQKHASLLMYRLFDWYDCHSHSRSHNSVDQSICLASLIFMLHAAEPNSSFGSRLSKVVTNLQAALQNVPVVRWSNSPDLLFWTLTMGALGAKSLPKIPGSPLTDPNSSFFAEYYRLTLPTLGFSEIIATEIMLVRMRSCLWIPSVFDERVKRLWISLGLRKKEIVELEDISSDGELDCIVEEEYALGESTRLRFFTAD